MYVPFSFSIYSKWRLRLFPAGAVVEFPLAPFLFATFPDDCVFAQLFERCEHTAFYRGYARICDGGEAAAELFVDFVERIVLVQLAMLLDGRQHPLRHVTGFSLLGVGIFF